MCGIGGFYNLKLNTDSLHFMQDAMAHRGPDDRGIFFRLKSPLGLHM
jgi:asparagine synthetase B (glutamine-hydrolysing)